MEQTKHTVVLSGVTALRALRRERRISSEITWGPVELNEQIDAMRRATCLSSLIDLEDLERLGILVENEQIDLAVGRIAKRTATPPVIAHCIGNLGEGGLMRIAKELYALSPAALTLDLARDSSFEGLLALMEELSGNWSLPERPLGTNELDDSLDFIDKPCGYYESAPALDLEELRSFHAAATRMRGRKAAETAVKYAVGGSRSPMEAIMNCVFALPHEYGGLNCRPVETNRKIEMDETAHALSGLPYVIADAYLPRFNTILEYNGSYHDDATIRRRDEARTLGLMSMGIDVYRLNSDQLRDPNALVAIARMIHRRSGRFFRPRAKCYQQKHLQLLNGLRKAFGLN